MHINVIGLNHSAERQAFVKAEKPGRLHTAFEPVGPCDDREHRRVSARQEVDGHITTALLLAAGTGSRLKPLTDNAPKCLTEVNGVPILGRLVRCLVKQGFNRLVVVVGYLDGRIREYLEANARGLTVDFVDCPDYATTNNIYSLWLARDHIHEPFVLIESDLVFDSDMLRAMRTPDHVAVARFQAPMTGTTVSLDPSGRVVSFHVGADPRGGDLCYKTVNVYSLSLPVWQEVVRRLERRITAGHVNDYYEVVFAEMVADRALAFQAVHFDSGRWYEIDTIEDLCMAEQLFSEGRRVGEPQTTNDSLSGNGS